MTELTEQQKVERLAEGVMGWKKEQIFISDITEYWIGLWKNGDIGKICKVFNWNPFKSWNDAGMVLEKLNESWKWNLSQSYGWKCEENLVYSLKLEHRQKYRFFLITNGNTAQEAICEAALATLEEK